MLPAIDPSPLPTQPVPDRLGRVLRDLRISVMDRCNFRCPYCMPEKATDGRAAFLDDEQRLDFGEIVRLCRIAAGLGVRKLRLTGGEPLLRPGLPSLVALLRRIDGIEDLALTTNGVLLPRHALALRQAGLDRVTISLDSLDPAVFRRMSGNRGAVDDVLRGIDAAQRARFPRGIKINTVVQRSVNEDGALDLLERFRGSGIALRFIEYMDVGSCNGWNAAAVVPADELLERIDARWPLDPVPPRHPGEVATRFRFRDGGGEIGMIASVSAPFCGGCTRARLSSEGILYTCLFAHRGTDLRSPLRAGADDEDLGRLLRGVWLGRGDRYSEERFDLQAAGRRQRKIEMHYIGG